MTFQSRWTARWTGSICRRPASCRWVQMFVMMQQPGCRQDLSRVLPAIWGLESGCHMYCCPDWSDATCCRLSMGHSSG